MPKDPVENLKASANVYGCLARLWISELEDDELKSFYDPGFRDAYLELGGFLPQQNDSSQIEKLQIEYCECFLGPKGHLPPYQSVVNQSRFQGDCVSSMKEFIEIIGMPEGSLFSREKMKDHAGIQLALMQRIDMASIQCEAENIEVIEDLRNTFFVKHVHWIIDYCAVGSERTKSEFYSGLFRVTGMFLKSETVSRHLET